MIKLPLSTETLIWLYIIGWVEGNLLRCKYYHEYLACEEEDSCEQYILLEEDWELLSGECLVILLKFLSYSLTALERQSQFQSMSYLVSENKLIYFLICSTQMKITWFIFVKKLGNNGKRNFSASRASSCVPKSSGDGKVSSWIFWDWQQWF